MFAADVMQTIAEAYQEIRDGADPWVAIGDFGHDWYGNYPSHEERCALVAEPLVMPEEMPELQLRQWAAFCAASVEYLCQEAGLEVPAWVNDSRYTLPEEEAFYTSPLAQKERVRLRLQREAPEPFRRRNVFCSARVYANKYTAPPMHRQSA